MTLTELQNEVYILTNRPDLVAQTLSAVRTATLKIHQSDYYIKDIFETGINFGLAAYQQQIEYRLIIPLYRSLKYLRKTDVNGSDNLGFFDVIVPGKDGSLDAYDLNQEDVCYQAGSVIQIRSSTQFQYALLGCYLNPNIGVLTFDSWVALDHPYAIIYEATAAVFKMIGDTDQFKAYTDLANIQIAEVKMSNILTQGY